MITLISWIYWMITKPDIRGLNVGELQVLKKVGMLSTPDFWVLTYLDLMLAIIIVAISTVAFIVYIKNTSSEEAQ